MIEESKLVELSIINNNNNNKSKSKEEDGDDDIEKLIAPLAKLDLIDDWRELLDDIDDDDDNDDQKETNFNSNLKNSNNKQNDKNLCKSLEDLVNTFDVNIKKCFDNYKDVDISKLAPVQVRNPEDIMNDSQ